MPRLATIILVAGILAAAVGFGDFAGVPNQVIFIARIVAGVCFLLVIANVIANYQPTAKADRRPPRDHRPASREQR